MINVPQSVALLVVFKAYLASDHVTEATGKTIAITISKNGGAFGNPNAGALNATEITSGWYKAALDTTDTATLGPLAVRGAVATIDDVGIAFQVVTPGLTAAAVNAEVVDALNVDTYAEPSGVPAATAPITTKIGYLHMALRNRVDVTTSKKQFYNDGGTVEWEKDLSDNGTTYSETEGNGP